MGSPLADALLNQQPMVGPVPLSSMVGLGQVPTQADAMDYNSSAIGNAIAAQRAISAQRGLWNDETGMPTQAGVADAANQVGQGLLMGSTAPGIRAFHGSPHSFDQFDLGKIGTGEGAQAYGHGLYFAGNEGVAQGYRDKLTVPGPTIAGRTPDPADPSHIAAVALAQHGGSAADAATAMQHVVQFPHVYGTDAKTATEAMGLLHSGAELPAVQLDNPGHMYEVNLNADPAHMLDWDKPLSEQSQQVQDAVMALHPGKEWTMQPTAGGQRYNIFHPGGWQTNGYPGAYSQARAQAIIDAENASTNGLGRTGEAAYRNIGRPEVAAEQLKAAGIPGIRYLDGGSRGAGEGTSNYVMFNPEHIDILRKYGLLGTAGGAAASPFGFAAAGQGQQ